MVESGPINPVKKGEFDEWTNWSSCCNGVTKRRKMVEVEGELKNKTETLTCNRDECPGETQCILTNTFVITRNNTKLQLTAS